MRVQELTQFWIGLDSAITQDALSEKNDLLLCQRQVRTDIRGVEKTLATLLPRVAYGCDH